MTVYRLCDGQSGRPGNGPSPNGYSGPFIAGTQIVVTEGGMWLNGYYAWVGTGGDTTARTCALWQVTGTGAGSLVSGSTVTSGTLTAGQWNFIALSSPVALSIGTDYQAQVGWTCSAGGFYDTQDFFDGTGTYPGGIINGPLAAYSDSNTEGGTYRAPYSMPQGLFDDTTANAGSKLAASPDTSSFFWVDVQVSDQAPAGFTGPYQFLPNNFKPQQQGLDDDASYTIGMEFTLSEPCTLNAIGFYSPSGGGGQLPDHCGIWDVSTQELVAGTHLTNPSWSGAAGSGWVQAAYSGVTLPAGDYKVSVAQTAATGIWNATVEYFFVAVADQPFTSWGGAPAGLTWGPLSVPDAASATSPGQCTYFAGTTFSYPDSYIASDGYYYGLDVLVTPVASGSGLLLAMFP